MKIVLPYSAHKGFDVNSTKMVGGIEKFIKEVADNFDVIPVRVTEEDKKANKIRQIVESAIGRHEPDMLMLNQLGMGNYLSKLGIPIVAIWHEPLIRTIALENKCNYLKQLQSLNAHVYMVSEYQEEWFREQSIRTTGSDFDEIHGHIHPSYLKGNEVVYAKKPYDVGTIGSAYESKNPFYVHKQSDNELTSLVLTNDIAYKNNAEYLDKNRHWQEPQTTLFDLEHNVVLETIAKCKVFCSSCPEESYGITAQEALGHGLPAILITDKSNKHASESIAVHKSHYRKLPRNCSKSDFIETVKELSKLPHTTRLDISEKTKEKHSLQNWKKQLENIFDKRLADKNVRNSLVDFFV